MKYVLKTDKPDDPLPVELRVNKTDGDIELFVNEHRLAWLEQGSDKFYVGPTGAKALGLKVITE